MVTVPQIETQRQFRPRPTIIRLKDVQYRTGFSRSTIYQRISQGGFPSQINLGARAVGWLECEIDDWLNDKIAQSRGGLQ